MITAIYKPCDRLSKSIEFFLFLKNDGGTGWYKTFPNTNTCLALYKENNVSWDVDTNSCSVDSGFANPFTSKLFGFHKKPFIVNLNGQVDQVCIIFKLGGIHKFTKLPVDQIEIHDHPFEQIFGEVNNSFYYELFSSENDRKRLTILEKFLLQFERNEDQRLNYLLDSFYKMAGPEQDSPNFVKELSAKLSVDASTLYRNFTSATGQSPIQVFKTIRFRKTLGQLLVRKELMTKTAYANNFYDQSHLIKNIRQFTGESPSLLIKKISSVGDTMFWVKN